jgi:hypothetical protein
VASFKRGIMFKFILIIFFIISTVSAQTFVPTYGETLYLTCSFDESPLLIEVSPNQRGAKIPLDNYTVNFSLAEKYISGNSQNIRLTYAHPKPASSGIESFYIYIPKFMDRWLGTQRQPAKIIMKSLNDLEGTCDVHFKSYIR